MADKFILNEDFDVQGADEASDVLGYDPDAEPTLEDQGWEYVASKDVYDEDGFRDSYMWYRKDGNNRFFFSSDVDYGDPEYFDWETEGDEAAQEWFDSYGEDEGDLTFVDNREAAILGKGDDPGFDEYDRVDEAKRRGINVGDYVRVKRNKNLPDYKGTVEDIKNGTFIIRLENDPGSTITVSESSAIISKVNLDESVEDKDTEKVKVHYYAKNVDAIAEETFDYDYFMDNKDKILSSYDDVVDVQVFDKDGYYLHDINEAVEDKLTAKAEIDTPRGTFYAYKGTWKDFENEDDRDDWGFWFDHYTDDNKHYKIMHNHIDNSAIAVLKEGLNESKRGFVEKYRGYSIHDAGDRYVITNENGLNVGETRFGIPVCHGMIDDMIDGKEADKITEAKRTKFPRGFNLGSSNNQNVKVRNPYNYTIQELSINNKVKTFERGNFSMGRADIELKNRQEYEDIVDLLKDQGYTEVKSDYHSLRNKTRKGIREGVLTSDKVDKETARKEYESGKPIYIGYNDGRREAMRFNPATGETFDEVVDHMFNGEKDLVFLVDHRPLTKDHLLDRIKERRKTIEEDTVKQNGKWVNKGKEGTHGKFNTKKEADAQRKAMFAQGFTEDLDGESGTIDGNSLVGKNYTTVKKDLYKNGYREDKENAYLGGNKEIHTWWKGRNRFIDIYTSDGVVSEIRGAVSMKESFSDCPKYYSKTLKLLDGKKVTPDNVEEYARELSVSKEKLYSILWSLMDDLYISGNEETGIYNISKGTWKELPDRLKESIDSKTISYKGKDIPVRSGAWQDVQNAHLFDKVDTITIDKHIWNVCKDKDTNEIFALATADTIDESFNNSSSSYYLTTVGDMIDGSVSNVDDEDIDKDLKFWRTVARTFNFVPGADNVAVLIADGEYDPEYYYPSWTNKPRAIAKKYPNAVFYDVPFFCVKEVKNGKMFLYFDSEESAKKYVDLIDSGIDFEDQDAYTEWADKHPLMRESLKEDLTPENDEETSIASNIITAIEDEWKTISLYNNIITILSNESDDKYKDIIPVIQDIVEEENVHVGQLQKALETISPDTAKIQSGEVEAGGQLQKGEEEESGYPTVESLKESIGDDDWDDFEQAGIYGGDMIYCPICGRRLEYDEDGDQFCPKCKKPAWDLAQDRLNMGKKSKNESVEENPDDDIEGTEWYSTDVKEIPYGKNKKRIQNRKLVDADKETVRKPVNEDLEDSKENATLIRNAIASGSLDRDAFIDYVLTNTPDEMLSGAVNFIGTQDFDTEDDLDFLGDGVDVTDSFANDLFIDEDTLEDGSVITLKDYSNGGTSTLQNDSKPACDDCDDLPDGVDITLVDVDDDKPLEEEKPLQEMGPLAATLLTAVAPVVADKVMDKVLPENKEEENKVDDEVYGNANDDDVDIKGI